MVVLDCLKESLREIAGGVIAMGMLKISFVASNYIMNLTLYEVDHEIYVGTAQ